MSSRYYDSNIGRFITKDDIEYLGVSATTVSYNLYTYCLNDPVCYWDSDGTFGLWALTGITLAASVIGGLAQMLSNWILGNNIFDGVFAVAVGSGVNALVSCLFSEVKMLSVLKYGLSAFFGSLTQSGIDSLFCSDSNFWIDFMYNFSVLFVGNLLASSLIKISSSTPEPITFFDAFCSEYGVKLIKQDIIGGTVSVVSNMVNYYVSHRGRKVDFRPCLVSYC